MGKGSNKSEKLAFSPFSLTHTMRKRLPMRLHKASAESIARIRFAKPPIGESVKVADLHPIDILELEVNCEADTVLVEFVASWHGWHVGVVETTHILDGEHLEDVADTDREFHVGFVAHHEGSLVAIASGETEEVVVVGLDEWIVAVSQVAVEHLESNVLTQLQFLQ